jgi:hypothetical protein
MHTLLKQLILKIYFLKKLTIISITPLFQNLNYQNLSKNHHIKYKMIKNHNLIHIYKPI